MSKAKQRLTTSVHGIDLRIIALLDKYYEPIGRVALFVVYFWFGFLKVIDISPASPLAKALTEQTIGLDHFHVAFVTLAVVECVIGVLFLVPRATRLAVLLMLIHMIIVCSPLILLPGEAWQSFLVPTLEGQYIIKNLALVAVALTIAARLQPLKSKAGSA